MDSEGSTAYAGGLKLSPKTAIDESGIFGTRRGLSNIRWFEYTFLALGILAALVTDGLTIVRLVSLGSFAEPEFAYGILIIFNSLFLLFFLITGLLYQRITDIVAYTICSVLLTVYVIQHYFTAWNQRSNGRNTQPEIRLARLVLVIVFNVCFIPLAYLVIKLYERDEFSKRLFGAFPAARRPLKIYSVFDCGARINTMLSISSLVLNLYNDTNSDTADRFLLGFGVPIAVLWLIFGIAMARLEKYLLVFIFYFLSLFQIGALSYILSLGIRNSLNIAHDLSTTTVASSTTPGQITSTRELIPNMLPVIGVLFVCVVANFLSHLVAMSMGVWCIRHFKQGLREKVFNTKIDKWIQARWSS